MLSNIYNFIRVLICFGSFVGLYLMGNISFFEALLLSILFKIILELEELNRKSNTRKIYKEE